jgi:SAM-dependent methyltransferase
MDAYVNPTLQLGADDLLTLLERFGPSLALWRAAEIAALRRQPIERPLLDLGCGDGLVATLAFSHIDIGVDPNGDAIARAQSLGSYRRLEQSAIEQADVAPHSVGTVVSNSVFEHVPDVVQTLRAVANVLRPGGRLILTMPTEAFSHWLAFSAPQYVAWRNRHYEHRNLWSAARWARHLNQTGFDVVAVHPYLSHAQVRLWDTLDLMQRPRLGGRRLFGLVWRRLPRPLLTRLAERMTRMNLSAPPPGGGRLIVAYKR